MPDDRFSPLDQYARELDHEADLVAAPTSPETVRRVAAGRTRRRTVIVVVLLLAAALAVSGAVIQSLQPRSASPQWGSSASPTPTAAGVSPTSDTPSPSVSSAPASTSASATPSTSVPPDGTVVTLASRLTLTSADDINAVTFLPDDAKAFLVTELARERSQWNCPTENLLIDGYRVGDLISGRVFGDTCGGDVILWGKLNGRWTALLEKQSVPLCSEVRATGWTSTIPESFLGGVCYPSATNLTPVPYTP